MKKGLIALTFAMSFLPVISFAKTIYLSCPELDERSPDLVVVLDDSNGTASLQAPSSGEGLNFTEAASFGPESVMWRKDFGNLKSTYSVNRSSLSLKRKIYSSQTGMTHVDESSCHLVKSPKNKKF